MSLKNSFAISCVHQQPETELSPLFQKNNIKADFGDHGNTVSFKAINDKS